MKRRRNFDPTTRAKTRKKKKAVRPFYIWMEQSSDVIRDAGDGYWKETESGPRQNNFFGPMEKKDAEERLMQVMEWAMSYIIPNSPIDETDEGEYEYQEKTQLVDDSIWLKRFRNFPIAPHWGHPSFKASEFSRFQREFDSGFELNVSLEVPRDLEDERLNFNLTFSIFTQLDPQEVVQEGTFFYITEEYDEFLSKKERTVMLQPSKDFDIWPKELAQWNKGWNWRKGGPY
jgi:hypothetical protein